MNNNEPSKPRAGSEWGVPRNRLQKFHAQIHDELMAAVEPLLFGNYADSFGVIDEFEKKFAAWRGYAYAATVSSGSAALNAGLFALGVKKGDEVICPANSDMADSNAIEAMGATIVLCDVSEDDYSIDPTKVEALITEKTTAILPVSLFGNPANVKALREIADRHGLKILEDAALSTCSMDYGHPLGYYADAVAFSTAATKPIGGLAYGGIVATNSKEVYDRVKAYSDYGVDGGSNNRPNLSWHKYVGDNTRMHPIDAAYLLVKLPYYDEQIEIRKQVSRWYDEKLAGIPHVELPKLRPESEPVRREYGLRITGGDGTAAFRDRVMEYLKSRGIQAATGYTPPLTQRMVYEKQCLRGSDNIPVTERIGNEMLTLPNDIFTTEEEVEYVAKVLREAVKG